MINLILPEGTSHRVPGSFKAFPIGHKITGANTVESYANLRGYTVTEHHTIGATEFALLAVTPATPLPEPPLLVLATTADLDGPEWFQLAASGGEFQLATWGPCYKQAYGPETLTPIDHPRNDGRALRVIAAAKGLEWPGPARV